MQATTRGYQLHGSVAFSTRQGVIFFLDLALQVSGRPATIDYLWATADLDLVAIYNPLKGVHGTKLAATCRSEMFAF